MAAGGIEVLAAILHLQDLMRFERPAQALRNIETRMLVRVLEFSPVLHVLFVVFGECDLVQRAADDSLRLLALGDDRRVDAVLAAGHPGVPAHEVQVVRPVHEQLRHPGVVVVVARDVAVGALLRSVLAADGVRHVGAEGDAGHALGRDGLLLHVDRFAVVVVGADVDRAARSGRTDAIAGDVAVAGQHVHFVPQRLEVVGRVIAADVAIPVQVRHLDVGPLRQVAAIAARVPGRVTGDARHVLIRVGAGLFNFRRHVAPDQFAVLDAHGLGQVRLLVVARVSGVDRVFRLNDLPAEMGLDHRVLIDHVDEVFE